MTERVALAGLDRKLASAQAAYDRTLTDEPELAATALRQVARIDRERDAQAQAIAEAEAVVGEWSGPPDFDAALDWYGGLVELVRGRVAAAQGVRELNTALSSVIASIAMELVDGRLSATFRLHIPEGEEPGLAGTGFSLTPVNEAQADRMRAYFEQPPDATTERFTFAKHVPVPDPSTMMAAPSAWPAQADETQRDDPSA